ncbi:MAG TPA: hypothetical protein GXX40_04450 [Firmicutes bacterium]|nr:hypothetical protein [Bacillota bacterium]
MTGFPKNAQRRAWLFAGLPASRVLAAAVVFLLASLSGAGLAKAWQVNAFMENKTEIVMQPGTPEVKLDGRLVKLDAVPYIKDGRMMVPFRFVGESLGARVEWIGESNTVIFEAPGKRIELQIGSVQARVNDSTVVLQVPAEIVQSRTFVPLRFVAEAMGAEVQWDSRSSTATITLSRKVPSNVLGGGARLKVRHVKASGLDFLASVTMLMNHHDASIDLPKAAIYGRAGRPPIALSESSLVLESMQNLGYSIKLACVGLPNEALLELLKAVPLSDGMVCKNSTEALNKLTQLLDSGTPVGVAVDLSILDLGEDLWGSEIVVVSGYDDSGLTLEVPSASKGARRVSREAFLKAWSKEEIDSPGPNFFFWVRKSSKAMSGYEVLRTARKDSEAAVAALKEYAAQIRSSGYSPGALLALKRMGYWSRLLVADYLASHNLKKAASKLRKAAETYDRLSPELPPSEGAALLEEAATLEAEALRYWP